jgi:hypothetical protein
MKKTWFHFTAMLFTITILMAVPLRGVLADGAGEGIEKEANGYHIRLIFVEPPKLGENEFHIQITDAMGLPVTKAEVGVIAMPEESMSEHDEDASADTHGTDSMSGMDMGNESETNEPPTHGEVEDSHADEPTQIVLEAGHEPGEYSGHISFNRTGEWILNVHFTVDGQLTEVEFPVTVAGLDAKYGILIGFAGINASVLSAAAIMKRKKNSIQP